MPETEVERVVFALWRAMSQRDWVAVKACVADDCIYVDMPLGPGLSARGPEDIVKRLQVGLETLAGYENHDGLLLCNGADAMYEHSETWTWENGNSVVLPFVSVHRVESGQITGWKDSWDFAGLTAHAPPGWLEGLASA